MEKLTSVECPRCKQKVELTRTVAGETVMDLHYHHSGQGVMCSGSGRTAKEAEAA